MLHVERITPEHENFCFGFHDLLITDDAGRVLAHHTQHLRRPPCADQVTEVGFFAPGSKTFQKIGTTVAFNYPQGARLEWFDAKAGSVIFNVRRGDHWGAEIRDIRGTLLASLDSTAHVVAPEQHLIFGINYARLNRLGAYGYAALPDPTASSNAPVDDGIWVNDIRENRPKLLYSIAEAAATIPENRPENIHYFTHLVMNPSHTRIAFLHRYRIAEGEMTRLMTIGVDGSAPRCLGVGSLSHFDWLNDDEIVIWGRSGSAIEKLRSSRLYSLLPKRLLRTANMLYHRLLGRSSGGARGQQAFVHVFADREGVPPRRIAAGVITQDGHMMVNPRNRDWFVCDTYPDKEGVRQLFLYQISTGRRIELGRFKRIFDEPDSSCSDDAFRFLDKRSLSPTFLKRIAFARSGLHCDLHPRWSSDGKVVYFDSIHEGERAIYAVDVSGILE